jgi:3-oxoadipate CoA-transferase beta subunit
MNVAISQQRLLSREQIARRLAQELQDGWLVNVGIGMPTLVLPHVPQDRLVIFHSENGIVGMGPPPESPEDEDPDLLSAGKGPVTLVTGGVYVHHADSFSIVRGGRLDAAILGAFQVAENGDLANWKLPDARGGNVGGAMDIAVGAREVFAMMTHATRDGAPKIVKSLSYPVTAMGAVTKIFSDMAVMTVTPDGLMLDEIAPGLTVEEVQAVTEPRLITATPPGTIAL